jgi:hypothetical protein
VRGDFKTFANEMPSRGIYTPPRLQAHRVGEATMVDRRDQDAVAGLITVFLAICSSAFGDLDSQVHHPG